MYLNLHNIIENTLVEGPGMRTAIWVQGCSIRCKGCMIPDTWDFEKGEQISIPQLVNKFVSNKQIEGITILGGEPFDQSEALLQLIKTVRKQSDLSIMLFSGYTREYLQKNKVEFTDIVQLIDILITGPYVESQIDFSREWVGSINQQIEFLTDRYKDFEVNKKSSSHKVEIRINKEGNITINGMLPSEELLESIDWIKEINK